MNFFLRFDLNVFYWDVRQIHTKQVIVKWEDSDT